MEHNTINKIAKHFFDEFDESPYRRVAKKLSALGFNTSHLRDFKKSGLATIIPEDQFWGVYNSMDEHEKGLGF